MEVLDAAPGCILASERQQDLASRRASAHPATHDRAFKARLLEDSLQAGAGAEGLGQALEQHSGLLLLHRGCGQPNVGGRRGLQCSASASFCSWNAAGGALCRQPLRHSTTRNMRRERFGARGIPEVKEFHEVGAIPIRVREHARNAPHVLRIQLHIARQPHQTVACLRSRLASPSSQGSRGSLGSPNIKEDNRDSQLRPW
mmetsp:Transcript_41428/g.131763  ORF Transcript_41428/g.131763 Transcript_41428/m.131763 type:complete len:201 (-) Transcript_41428:198-800(-)